MYYIYILAGTFQVDAFSVSCMPQNQEKMDNVPFSKTCFVTRDKEPCTEDHNS